MFFWLGRSTGELGIHANWHLCNYLTMECSLYSNPCTGNRSSCSNCNACNQSQQPLWRRILLKISEWILFPPFYFFYYISFIRVIISHWVIHGNTAILTVGSIQFFVQFELYNYWTKLFISLICCSFYYHKKS